MTVTVEKSYRELRSRAMEKVDEEYKQQVLNGIDWLNETYGPDWVEWVDPAILNLGSASHCVLGQIGRKQKGYQHQFDSVLNEHGHGVDWAEQHGFYTHQSYDRLTEAWGMVFSTN